jgi:hypothetical protein
MARIVQVASIMAYLLIASPFTTITANAQTKGAITGRVVADDGSGMAGVTVMLTPVATSAGPPGSYRKSTTTDEEGNFRFADLPARPYNLLVFSSREYTQAPAVTGSRERRYYRIGESVQITLIRGGVITGRVTTPLGGPVIAIQVTAIRVRDHEGRPMKDIIARRRAGRMIAASIAFTVCSPGVTSSWRTRIPTDTAPRRTTTNSDLLPFVNARRRIRSDGRERERGCRR